MYVCLRLVWARLEKKLCMQQEKHTVKTKHCFKKKKKKKKDLHISRMHAWDAIEPAGDVMLVENCLIGPKKKTYVSSRKTKVTLTTGNVFGYKPMLFAINSNYDKIDCLNLHNYQCHEINFPVSHTSGIFNTDDKCDNQNINFNDFHNTGHFKMNLCFDSVILTGGKTAKVKL